MAYRITRQSDLLEELDRFLLYVDDETGISRLYDTSDHCFDDPSIDKRTARALIDKGMVVFIGMDRNGGGGWRKYRKSSLSETPDSR